MAVVWFRTGKSLKTNLIQTWKNEGKWEWAIRLTILTSCHWIRGSSDYLITCSTEGFRPAFTKIMSCWGKKKVLWMNRDGGSTTVWMNIIPLIWIFKIG